MPVVKAEVAEEEDEKPSGISFIHQQSSQPTASLSSAMEITASASLRSFPSKADSPLTLYDVAVTRYELKTSADLRPSMTKIKRISRMGLKQGGR